MIKYYIVEAGSVLSLERQVKKLTDKGWRPAGGLAFHRGTLKDIFYQAMVLEVR